MNSRKGNVGETLEQSLGLFNKPSLEWMESAGKRALQRIGSVDNTGYAGPASDFDLVRPMRKPRWFVYAAAAVIIFSISMLAILRRGSPAELEMTDIRRTIQYGEIVRAAD